MKILIYCQYLLGVGHFFRIARIAAGLKDHEVVLVAGGPALDVDLPHNVRLVRQPGLMSDSSFSRLIPTKEGADLDAVKAKRAAQLLALMDEVRPGLLLFEQYPFGRGLFRFEIEPVLDAVGRGDFGRVKVVCSLRDILSVRVHAADWEARVLRRLNGRFHAVLVHGDAEVLPLSRTFSAVERIAPPVMHTGYVAPCVKAGVRRTFRSELGLGPGDRLVVAGLGGGRVGLSLGRALVDAFHDKLLQGARLRLFAGPLAEKDSIANLRRRVSGAAVEVVSSSSMFVENMAAADLAVGLAGYNTCMDIHAAKVPSLLHPLEGEPEQALRCRMFASPGWCETIEQSEIGQGQLALRMQRLLDAPAPGSARAIDDRGVAATARLLEQIVEGRA